MTYQHINTFTTSLSTRATYRFIGDPAQGESQPVVYKHHDGYPEGACHWIGRIADRNFYGPHIAATHFIREMDHQDGAELTAGHDAHSDTEFYYDIHISHGKVAAVLAYKYGYRENYDSPRRSHLIFCGTPEEMLQQFGNTLKVKWPEDEGAE